MTTPDPTLAAPPEIRLSGLTKRFGGDATGRRVARYVEGADPKAGFLAVDHLDLDVEAGEFFSLLGPSGCGKTTTLRMIGGFDLPTSGRVELRGRDVTRDPPDKRPVNMVFQSYALFPHLDVAGNIAFGLRRRGTDAGEIVRRTGAILEKVHLAGYEKRKPNELSGGQQQRVALARALVNEPNVLLLDEPLGALDLKLRKRLQVELKRIQMDVGITFVYVTHDQEEALTMSDRIAVMNRGRIEQVGTPEDLYDRPATPFVADFIGTTNLLSGTVEGVEEDSARVRLDSGDLCPVAPVGRRVGEPVQVSIRPEAISIAASTDGTTNAGGMRGAVEQVAYLGAAVQYHIRTAGGLVLSVLAGRTGQRFESGSSVEVFWQPAVALVLGDRPVDMEEPS